MNINNETCVQRSILRFNFSTNLDLKKAYKKSTNQHPIEKYMTPSRVRELKEYLNERLERIAQMMETLLSVHDDWAITERKNFIQLETISLDFHEAVKLLQNHGFDSQEYSLEVEYTRKWGVL